jgi:hypothetical protein
LRGGIGGLGGLILVMIGGGKERCSFCEKGSQLFGSGISMDEEIDRRDRIT